MLDDDDCVCESVSHHHQGEKHGHGPVLPEEIVAYAVFEKSPRDTQAERLTIESFDNTKLSKTNLSLARKCFTSPAQFHSSVVLPNQHEMGALVGVSCAIAKEIRSIRAPSVDGKVPDRHQGFCLIDRVELGDHEGHAALGYSSYQSQLSAKRRGEVRNRLRAALADKFSYIEITTNVFADLADSVPEN